MYFKSLGQLFGSDNEGKETAELKIVVGCQKIARGDSLEPYQLNDFNNVLMRQVLVGVQHHCAVEFVILFIKGYTLHQFGKSEHFVECLSFLIIKNRAFYVAGIVHVEHTEGHDVLTVIFRVARLALEVDAIPGLGNRAVFILVAVCNYGKVCIVVVHYIAALLGHIVNQREVVYSLMIDGFDGCKEVAGTPVAVDKSAAGKRAVAVKVGRAQVVANYVIAVDDTLAVKKVFITDGGFPHGIVGTVTFVLADMDFHAVTHLGLAPFAYLCSRMCPGLKKSLLNVSPQTAMGVKAVQLATVQALQSRQINLRGKPFHHSVRQDAASIGVVGAHHRYAVAIDGNLYVAFLHRMDGVDVRSVFGRPHGGAGHQHGGFLDGIVCEFQGEVHAHQGQECLVKKFVAAHRPQQRYVAVEQRAVALVLR